MKTRIYIDTSVIGGCEDEEFKNQSSRLPLQLDAEATDLMNKTEKQFDAVEMMRSIRNKLSEQIEGMTLEEELAWLASQDLKDPLLNRLREKAAQQAAAAAASRRG